jgi:hypothetical protein
MQVKHDFITDKRTCISSSFSRAMKADLFTLSHSGGVKRSPLRRIFQSVAVGVNSTWGRFLVHKVYSPLSNSWAMGTDPELQSQIFISETEDI